MPRRMDARACADGVVLVMPDTHPTPEPSACPFDDPREFAPPLSDETRAARPYATIPGWELQMREELLSKAGERMAGELGRVRDEMEIRAGRA
jgi:hypothetical protein